MSTLNAVSRPDVDRLLFLDEHEDEIRDSYLAAELWRVYVAELTRRARLDDGDVHEGRVA